MRRRVRGMTWSALVKGCKTFAWEKFYLLAPITPHTYVTLCSINCPLDSPKQMLDSHLTNKASFSQLGESSRFTNCEAIRTTCPSGACRMLLHMTLAG